MDNCALMQASPHTVVGRVVAQHRPTEYLRRLLVETDEQIGFKAGQFTKIGFPGEEGERDLMRSYSFVNPPGASAYEFCYGVLTEGGNLSPRLDRLGPGDELLVSTRPAGFLVLEELPPAKHVFFLATGTGIGPFLSIMATPEPWRRYDKVVLVHGVANAADLAYLDDVTQLGRQHPERFAFLPLVTREDHAGSLRMRIPQALAAGKVAECAGVELSPAECQFMLCGNPDMIKETTALLADRGFPRHRRSAPGNVTIEKYW